MKTIIFYVVAALCLLASKLSAQETFEDRVHIIAKNMDQITKEQKDSLKIEVDNVNQLLEKGDITAAEAEKRKKEFAEKRARNIEERVATEEQKLSELVKDKVDGKIATEKRKHKFSFSYQKGDNVEDKTKNDTVKQYSFKRTTSQFVFALGINRLVANDKIDQHNFKDRSDFYEWGLTFNTRIFKNNNLLHAKYGLSLQYNNLRPENDRIFTTTDDGQTVLAESGRDLKLSRFRYVNLVVPVHLEFDFTPKKMNGDKTYFPTHQGFRIGLGGYAGFNVKEKQITKYSEDGRNVKHKEKGDYNVNDFVYGVSAYIGYGEISLYAKYDLQPVFANNAVDQNNLSLGIRFDMN
ncbi:hypothetical protein CHU92_03615 [Flavobacterium cyanobacteriorum]|uniref:Outer membrane protein beta-barrel domain-containing protein n=1 Tax=Flavobacterium cyanobacteriorum TaxID=2022802 RepID=A0A255ZP17_9FLAO|nr:hypothetical protein [Flavobacterium cyanobacteriorum]OYQ43161.1 hypothetical protein CHU92_03615 [Flavobacterium cyanobacteriorum]